MVRFNGSAGAVSYRGIACHPRIGGSRAAVTTAVGRTATAATAAALVVTVAVAAVVVAVAVVAVVADIRRTNGSGATTRRPRRRPP